VKTNILFFDKTTSTNDIRYYEVDPSRKLTKNKPITYEDMQELVSFFPKQTKSDKSWVVNVKDIKDYDISAKNPSKIKEITHETPEIILEKIKENEKKIGEEMRELEKILKVK
jgi:type I restriction enzyme M protein